MARPSHKVIPTFRDVNHLEKWFIRQRRLMLGLPIEKVGQKVPWGYKPSKEDPNYLLPIEKCFEYLVQAKEFCDDSTFNDVAEWLTKKCGHSITGEGLRQILIQRMPDDQAKGSYRKRQKRCAEKIEDKTW